MQQLCRCVSSGPCHCVYRVEQTHMPAAAMEQVVKLVGAITSFTPSKLHTVTFVGTGVVLLHFGAACSA
jgi:hypothetical protein